MPETLVPTPTADVLPRRFADFATLGEALDYAAQGVRGLNFHDPRGMLVRVYPYRRAARGRARRRPPPDRARRRSRSDRVALVAETGARIRRLVLRRDLCRRLAGAAAAADLVRRQANPISTSSPVQLESSDPTHALLPGRARRHGRRRRRGGGRQGPSTGRASSPREAPRPRCPRPNADDIAYLQYSSGSTRFPHGVAITHRGLLNNLAAHSHRHGYRPTATAASPGCPGITTWAWSAACCRRSPTRSRPIISRPRISPAARSPGST